MIEPNGPTLRGIAVMLYVLAIPALFFLGLVVDSGGEVLWAIDAGLVVAGAVAVAFVTWRNRDRDLL